MSISAIVFDFDGVIADTEGLHLGAFQEVFAGRGWTLSAPAYFDRYLGCDDRGLVAAFARDEQLSLADAEVSALVEAKALAFARRIASGDVLYPHARPSIERLAAHFAIGIASGSLHREIASILRAAGLGDLFTTIIGADDVTAHKPSPEPYLAAAARLGVSPASCVAIEDSPPGLEAARNAGMRTIALTTTSPGHALAGADRVVASLGDVTAELVLELGSLPRL
jgi:HAD superfamily hydrolase (TIGR01509 family)